MTEHQGRLQGLPAVHGGGHCGRWQWHLDVPTITENSVNNIALSIVNNNTHRQHGKPLVHRQHGKPPVHRQHGKPPVHRQHGKPLVNT